MRRIVRKRKGYARTGYVGKHLSDRKIFKKRARYLRRARKKNKNYYKYLNGYLNSGKIRSLIAERKISNWSRKILRWDIEERIRHYYK